MSARERMLRLLAGMRLRVLLLVVSAIASGLLEAALLVAIAKAAAAIVSGQHAVVLGAGSLSWRLSLWSLIALAGALAAMRFLLQAPLATLPARIGSAVQAGLRRRLFDAYSRATWELQANEREGHLQEMMSSQVIQATAGVMQSSQLLIAWLTFMSLMVTAMLLSPFAALAIIAAAGALYLLLRPLRSAGVGHARELSAAQLRLAGGVGEAGRVGEEARIFGVAAAQRQLIERLISETEKRFLQMQRIGRLVPSIYQGTIYLLLIGALAGIYAEGARHASALGAIVLLVVRAGTYGQQMQSALQALRQSLPFIERLQDTADAYAAAPAHEGGEPLAGVERMELRSVSFSYSGRRPVLEAVDLSVEAGTALGVIGPSGAGKSTLISILLRLRAPSTGSYLINGSPGDGFRWADWSRLVAYVPQQPRLLHSSVAENIAFMRPIDAAAIERAAKLARIHEEVISWPRGYETLIGPRADAISGGQQQRICIARALAAGPSVLILDEPTSSLDGDSEQLIGESLAALKGRLTVIVVAHRRSTLSICDRIVRIAGGRLEELAELPPAANERKQGALVALTD